MVVVVRGTDQDVSLIVIGEVGVVIVLAHFRRGRRLVAFRTGGSSGRRGQHLVSSVIGRHDDRMLMMRLLLAVCAGCDCGVSVGNQPVVVVVVLDGRATLVRLDLEQVLKFLGDGGRRRFVALLTTR